MLFKIFRLIKKIFFFRRLNHNWDTHGAAPIRWETIFNSLKLLKIIIFLVKYEKSNLYVSPLANGQIEFEWIGFYKEIIFLISEGDSKQIEFLTVEKKGYEEVGNEYVMNKNNFLNFIR